LCPPQSALQSADVAALGRLYNRSYQVVFGAYLATDRSIRVIDPNVPQEFQP
jgi:hypothetical protein